MTAPMGGNPTPGNGFDQYGRPIQSQPQQWGQPQPQQQQPQQPPQLQGLDLNARLSGAGIPQELQGRTVGEALRYYQVMREDFLNRNNSQQQQLRGQPAQQQPQYQQQPPRQQNGQYAPQQPPPQQQQQVGSEAAMDQLVNTVMQRIAPQLQRVTNVSASSVYQQVRSRFPDWGQLDALIQESLQGATPDSLLDPRVWEAAYYHAKGRASTPGAIQQQNGQPWQPTPQNVQQGYAGGNESAQGYPQQQWGQPPMAPPQQQPSAYFVESPTPSAPMAPVLGADPRDEVMARRSGLSLEQYRRDKARVLQGLEPEVLPGQPGFQPQQPQQQYQQQPPYQQPQQQPAWMTGTYPTQPNGGYRG